MTYSEINIPQRLIMTPGPVETHPLVQQAMSNRVLGQFDPAFLELMDDLKELIKVPFHTKNEQAFAVDGSGRSGLEAALIALVEEGDKILVPAFGRFALLLAEICERAGGEVILWEKDWEGPFEQADVVAKLEEVQPKILAMVHGETANGQVQAVDEIGAYCQANDVFFMLDCVATYAGVPIHVDDWGVDIAVGGSQKCVSAPAGHSFVTYNARTEEYIQSRYQKELGIGPERNERHIQSNYLDLSQLQRYWSPERINHHTESTVQVYGSHTALRLINEEGAENVWARHSLNDDAIVAGIKAMGLEIFGQEETKMSTVTPVMLPEGVNDAEFRSTLLEEFNVEVAGTFGELSGKAFRIGNMGYSSRKSNVLQLLGAIEAVMIRLGADVTRGEAVQAAMDVYANN